MGKEILKGHKKHADIPRLSLGKFGRIELGLLGAPCGVIKSIVEKLAVGLRDRAHVTYLDADHQEGELPLYANMTDHISHDSITASRRYNEFDRKLAFTSSDLLLINSNHFLSDHQIVFCTNAKKDSLQRKLDRLTDVRLIILDEEIDAPHEFLDTLDRDLAAIPTCGIRDYDKMITHVADFYDEYKPKVKGLILAGGKSQRMGTPKEKISYHGTTQIEHTYEMLRELGVKPYVSCRSKDQAADYEGHNTVVDSLLGLGPFGAICSAFMQDPDSAWFVMACDQPLLGASHIQKLLDNRDTSKMATCYHNPETGFPEPLITIWEPRSYQRLLAFLTLGYSCPRKVLINSDVQELHVDDTLFMKNANTPEEREEIARMLK